MSESPSWKLGGPLADTRSLGLGRGLGAPLADLSGGYGDRNKAASFAQLPGLRRSSSGAGLSAGLERQGEQNSIGAIGSSGLRAVRTARLLSSQLELLAPTHLIEVRKALATLQTAGLHEVADVSGLHEQVVAKLASLPAAHEAAEPEVMLAPALQTGLVFDFTMEQIEDTDAVGKGLIGLTTLRSLRLRFCRCPIPDVLGLGDGIKELSALKELHIDFAGCTSLTNVDQLGKGIGALYGIDTLYLNFQGFTSLEGVGVLANAIKSLSALKTLTLNFQDCTALKTDAAIALGGAISALKMLTDLDMNVCGSRVRRGVQRPTILEPGPLGITNYIKQQSPTATPTKHEQ